MRRGRTTLVSGDYRKRDREDDDDTLSILSGMYNPSGASSSSIPSFSTNPLSMLPQAMITVKPENKNFDTTCLFQLEPDDVPPQFQIPAQFAISPGPLVPLVGGVYKGLLCVPVGTGPTQHVGRKIHVTSVELRWTYVNSHPNANVPFRLVLVRDNQPKVETPYNPAVAEVFSPMATASAGNFYPMPAYYNLSNKERFTTVFNIEYNPKIFAPATYYGSKFKPQNFDCIFNSGTDVVSRCNYYLFAACADSSITSVPSVYLRVDVRVRFSNA